MATGQLVTCILTARDGRGEPLGFGGDKFLAAVRGPGHVASEIFDRGDGTYEVVLLAPPSPASIACRRRCTASRSAARRTG